MSIVKDSSYKAPLCGGTPQNTLKDVLGGVVNLQVVGTDPHVTGVKLGSSITVGTGDYAPPTEHTNMGTFLICIETAGVFFVTLEDGTDFYISTVQSTAYLGQWYPAKLLSVNVSTSGNFSVGY
jgi:hypothetical protein